MAKADAASAVVCRKRRRVVAPASDFEEFVFICESCVNFAANPLGMQFKHLVKLHFNLLIKLVFIPLIHA